jgi:hypothetical protein
MINLRRKNPRPPMSLLGSEADITPRPFYVCFAPESGCSSAQRFDEAPKPDSCLGSGTVPVIAIPLAFRRAAASAVRFF